MPVVDSTVTVVHLLVGAVWVGSVVFVATAVLPAAREGTLDAASLESLAGSVTSLSRGGSLLMLLTGGYLAGTDYTVASLTGSPDGHLVLTMVALWLALTGLVEVGRGRLVDGLRERKVRTPADEALTLFRVAALVGGLLLVVAGLLAS